YEQVNIPRSSADDWDGRLASASYTDPTMSPPVTREIDRSGTTITYPGGDSYTYSYSGDDLASITHNSTSAAVQYSWDSFHNLTSYATSADTGALVSLAYTYSDPDARHIAAATATDILGNQATANFNAWNLPTSIRALASAGSGHSDQISGF